MTTRESFESALDARPDDAGTRLVYADWMEEHRMFASAHAQRWMVYHKRFPEPPDRDTESQAFRSCWMLRWEPVRNITDFHTSRMALEKALANALADRFNKCAEAAARALVNRGLRRFHRPAQWLGRLDAGGTRQVSRRRGESVSRELH